MTKSKSKSIPESKSESSGDHFKEEIVSSIDSVQVTVERQLPNIQNLQQPGVARAYQAPSEEKPRGSEKYSEERKDKTVLQQHCDFWDPDGDGVIWPRDTFVGFRDLGFNFYMSLLGVFIIHSAFSFPSRLSFTWIPDPFFRISVKGIHKCKHGSDSGSYDNEGRFVPQKFEEIFSKYDTDGKGGLTFTEMWNAMKGYRVIMDFFGWFALFFELGTTYLLIAKDGVMTKEDMRRVYDGSLFYHVREVRRAEKQGKGNGWNQGWGLGGDSFFGATRMKKSKAA
eukprot:TRINITY_DN4567_c0_g1_i1.p1 TRINITY_DN4567_c0_g1~~TRINITY_DN4567_c0_g1_i1.p1  ORF type:complete len:282 (+),score=73.68 TRINITY_DN4567_c0_g1_i1:95-940(+)